MLHYINYNDYLNLKNNYKNSLLLRYKIIKNNKSFLDNMLKNDYYFDNYKLDIEQKKSIFINEKNMLVLAGAGSGKTLTITAKVDYLINELNINENDILCLSFTNESVKKIKEKIKYDIDIFTFHKLALEILKDYKTNYYLAPSDYLDYVIREIFYSICGTIDEKILNNLSNSISSFINIYKVEDISIEILNKIIKRNKDKLLLVIEKILYIYQEELYSSGLIDFNDLISLSIKLIKEKGLRRYYKYIIIDEFQDISISRFKLLKEIIDSCNSYVFAVGDDYQSIYRFAGSRIDLITKFKKYFGYTKIIKINNTYRNSDELIKAASNFILKNKHQIKKRLKSDKHLDKPIKIIYYKKNEDILLKRILNLNENITILCRNNNDIKVLKNVEILVDKIKYNNKEFNYITIHKSKGLEFDNVIILNLKKGLFPSEKHNNINDLIQQRESNRYEEERRLFYVALTRTKNYVYLLVGKEEPSLFVKELVKQSNKYIEVVDI